MYLRTRLPALVLAAVVALAPACDDDAVSPPPGGTAVDRSPPQAIDDLALAYDAGNDAVVFSWTARRDDIAHDRADRYDIRYGHAFPFDWERSTRIGTPPAPLVAGSAQTFELGGPSRGRDFYASIRALDAAGNESPVGAVGHVYVPGYTFEATCLDALTDAPVEGLDALVTARVATPMTTGPDGRIAVGDLADGTLGVLITTGAASAPYHRFTDAFTLAGDVSLMYAMIPFEAPASPLYTSILELLRAALHSPGGVKIVKTWRTFPIQWYAPEFVNAYGLDYRALAEQAAARWNERTGMVLFAPTASDPAVGVLWQFLPRSVMGTVNGITEYDNDAEGYPRHDRIRIVDDFADAARLYQVMMHELGHTLPLGHLSAGFIMFASQPLPPDITDDEVRMVQLLVSLPNGVDLAGYDPSPPTP